MFYVTMLSCTNIENTKICTTEITRYTVLCSYN